LTGSRAKVVIIGYGNPLRGDDGVGCLAAGELAALFPGPYVDVICCHQLTPELAETCSEAELAVFIDAAYGPTPGEITCVQVTAETTTADSPTTASPLPLSFSHHLTPTTLLTMAQQLYGKVPAAYVLSIVGQSFAPGDQLSPPVQDNFPQLISQVKALVAKVLPDCLLFDMATR